MAAQDPISLGGAATDPVAPRMLVSQHFEPGSVLAERYEVIERVGGGGMGAVYRVKDRELGETVALKVLRALGAPSPLIREAWRQEVRLARKVLHPNVCRVFDIGEAGDVLFLTMELAEGQSLRRLLSGERPAPHAALDLLIQAASGLAAVHERGIVHRDVKPENIIVGPGGRAVLVDFGLAVTEEGSEGPSGGTPGYSAPEQVRGEQVDARADVFSMGVVAFELLTGARPSPLEPAGERTESGVVLRRAIPTFPGWPAEARGRITDVLDRALSLKTEERFKSAAELVDAFGDVRRSLEPVALPPPRGVSFEGLRSRRGCVSLGTAGLLVATILAAILWWRADTPVIQPEVDAGTSNSAAPPPTAEPVPLREKWQTPPWIRVLAFEARRDVPEIPEIAAAATDAAAAAVRARSDVRLCEAPCNNPEDGVSTLRGTVIAVGDQLRVEVQLLDGSGAGHPEPFDLAGSAKDVASLLQAVRRRVAEEARLFARARQRRLRDVELSTNEVAKKALEDYRALVGPRLLEKQIPLAEPLLDAAIAADPGYVPALLERAYLRMLKPSLDGAQDDVQRALEARPGDPEATIMRCSVLQYRTAVEAPPSDGLIKTAMLACTDARAAAPDHVNPLRFIARLYDLTCQDDLAMGTLQEALALDSSRTGDVAHHLIELALQSDKLPLADRISEQLVAFQENELREGPRALARKAGVDPTTGAYLKRASVLLRLKRWEEARVALDKELSLASPGYADEWTEAAALRGLVLLAAKGYGDVAPESRRRLDRLEKGFPPEVALGVAGMYALIDRDAALSWLARSPMDSSCGSARYRAAIYRLAGDVEHARTAARACQPQTEQQKRCVDWASR